MTASRNLIFIYLLTSYGFRGLARPARNYKSSNHILFEEERTENNQFLFQESTSSIVEKDLVLGNNSEPSQTFATEINNNNKRRKRYRKFKIINNEDNDDENFTENIDTGNSQDINTLPSETNVKQDLLPLSNLSNNSSHLIDKLLKNISYYNGEILNGGNLPINLFLGDNISVINYIALSPDSNENPELERFEAVKSYEISPIEGESNSESFHSLSTLEICTTQETTLTDISQTDLEVTQAVTSVVQLSESTTVSNTPFVTNIDNISINLTTFDLSISNLTTQLPIDTEVVTTTLVTELTTLDDSTCESDFIDNSLKPVLLTVLSTAATICITVQSSDINNDKTINTISTTVNDSTVQPLDSVLSDSNTVTPIEQTHDIVTDANTSADTISTPALSLRKNKRSRLRSGETFGDSVKTKKSVKIKSTRAKKRRNGDLLKYPHKQNMEIE